MLLCSSMVISKSFLWHRFLVSKISFLININIKTYLFIMNLDIFKETLVMPVIFASKISNLKVNFINIFI